ncbi:CvpA family protein [Qipengyuania sediminis]|uniref:CvpA family protein n=1 Tax=Qipengyuania sediminis TaxID=1532023 RepID=UPI00105A9896|nr:CvpA family protein [Qipengyuania sediminis]
MTGFDFIVLGIVAIAAIGGFLRGFVQEVASLAAWIFAALAVRFIHTPLTMALAERIGYGVSTSILAFALLLLIPYAAMKVIANNLGKSARNSPLGPIDRVLGFGFGGVKGVVVVIIAFSLLVLGYDTVWGLGGRPTWITTARSYDLVDAGSRSLVEMIAERRAEVRDEAAPAAGS